MKKLIAIILCIFLLLLSACRSHDWVVTITEKDNEEQQEIIGDPFENIPVIDRSREPVADEYFDITKHEVGLYISPRFKEAGDFSEGLAPAKEIGKFGFIDITGEFVIEPVYDFARNFRNGFAPVMYHEKWGLIDKKGNWVIEPKYQDMYFSGEDKKGYWHYALLYYNFDCSLLFQGMDDNNLVLCVQNDNAYGVMNTKEEWILEPRFGYIDWIYGQIVCASRNEKYGLVNFSGEWFVEPVYKQIRRFNEGYAVVITGDELYGAIDLTGEVVVTPQWEDMYDCKSSCFAVKHEGRWGVVDLEDTLIIPTELKSICPFVSDTTIAEFYVGTGEFKDLFSEYYIIDKKGKKIRELEKMGMFRHIGDEYFICRVSASVHSERKWRLIDSKGNTIFESENIEYLYYSNGLVFFDDSKNDNHYGICDLHGNIVFSIEAHFFSVDVFQDGIASITVGIKTEDDLSFWQGYLAIVEKEPN